MDYVSFPADSSNLTEMKDSAPLSPVAVLRSYPTFRRLWAGAMVSALGDTLTWLALLWFVLEKTDSGAMVGGVLLCFALPAALTSTPIGRFLDRFQPRTIMVVDNVLRAFIIAAIPLFHWLGNLTITGVYIIAVCAGALSPVTQIGVRVVIPASVPDNALLGANAAMALTQQISVVFGPVIAGLVIARWGAPNALLLDAVTFLLMAWALAGAPDISRKASLEREDSASIGWKTMLASPAVITMTLVSFVFFFAYGPTETALPVHIKKALNTDAQGFGWLWSALGVGSILGGLSVSYLSRQTKPGLALGWIAALWGFAQAGVALAPTLNLAIGAMFVGGVVWGPYTALETSLIQRIIPSHRLGSVFGARTTLLTPAVPLGTAAGGFLLTIVSARDIILISALACVVGGTVALLSPGLRRIRQENTTGDGK